MQHALLGTKSHVDRVTVAAEDHKQEFTPKWQMTKWWGLSDVFPRLCFSALKLQDMMQEAMIGFYAAAQCVFYRRTFLPADGQLWTGKSIHVCFLQKIIPTPSGCMGHCFLWCIITSPLCSLHVDRQVVKAVCGSWRWYLLPWDQTAMVHQGQRDT